MPWIEEIKIPTSVNLILGSEVPTPNLLTCYSSSDHIAFVPPSIPVQSRSRSRSPPQVPVHFLSYLHITAKAQNVRHPIPAHHHQLNPDREQTNFYGVRG